MFSQIKYRVILIFCILGVLPLGGFMIWEFKQSQDRLRDRVFEQLKTVREIKKREIEWYFSRLRDETRFFAQSNVVINAMIDFKRAFNELKPAPLPSGYPQRLRSYYLEELKPKLGPFSDSISIEIPTENASVILQNQYLIGTKAAFADIPYFDIHNKYHNAISSFINTYDLYDLFLVEDETGFIVYSVSKEVDFGTSLLSGTFANSNLGNLFRKIRYTGLKAETLMCDFERYLPSKLIPSAFIASPIFEGDRKIGTLILQVPLNKIDEITTGKKEWQAEGLGETGETYIVGSDYRMRTDSRFMIESSKKYIETALSVGISTPKEIELMQYYKTTVLFQKVHTETVEKALAKTSGTKTIIDYRKREVLSSYSPLDIKDVSWAILAEIDADEIFTSINQGARKSVFILFIVTLILIIASVLLARTIYLPIRILASGTKELGKGNFDIHINVKSKDELGLLAGTFNSTIQSLREQRQEILMQNNLLDQHKNELEAQAENLKSLNEEIVKINQHLDEKVNERTLRLKQQNEKLVEYAHINSHRLRAPVATILGLINIIKVSPNEDDKKNSLVLLEKATQELDKIVHDIQDIIDEAEFKE